MKNWLRILLLLLTTHTDGIPITLEYATTKDQRAWGLMQRTDLPENHGMLFIYQKPKKLKFWSFNCLMDLSVAFLDKNGLITEIQELKSYPEMMDSLDPIKTYQELKKYPPSHPVVLFFEKHSITSSYSVPYALEMRANWFKDYGVNVGDRLVISIDKKSEIRCNKGEVSKFFKEKNI